MQCCLITSIYHSDDTKIEVETMASDDSEDKRRFGLHFGHELVVYMTTEQLHTVLREAAKALRIS